MGLDPVLSKNFPRDFKNIPLGTDYGKDEDLRLNKELEDRKLAYLENELNRVLTEAVATKERPMFTTALIAGDAVILDALAKNNLLSKVPVVFVDTFTLFPESIAHLREVEAHYGFQAIIYNAQGCSDQKDYESKYGRDYWMKDIDQYDMLCKVIFYYYYHNIIVSDDDLVTTFFYSQVEPMNRALKEQNSDSWINGRRRDHGFERAALPVWEGKKVFYYHHYYYIDCIISSNDVINAMVVIVVESIGFLVLRGLLVLFAQTQCSVPSAA